MGLFGSNRKKDLWDAINSSQEGYAAGYTPQDQGAYDPTPDAAPDRKGMSPLKAGLLGFLGGPGTAQAIAVGRERDDQQAALEQKQASIAAAQNSAYNYLVNTAKMDPRAARAMAMDPSVVASFAKEAYAPQHFGADGGSMFNPITGQSQVMPSERQIGRNVYRFGADGTEQKVHGEIEPQSVPGVGLYGWDGTKGGIVDPRQTQQTQQAPQATGKLSDEEIVALEGGSGHGPKTFRPRRRLFGSY